MTDKDECRNQLVELKEAVEQALNVFDSTGAVSWEECERLEVAALDLLLDWAKAPINMRQAQ